MRFLHNGFREAWRFTGNPLRILHAPQERRRSRRSVHPLARARARVCRRLDSRSPYIAGKARGVDLRKHGSGNLGATNVFRVLGWKIGVARLRWPTSLKGALPVLLSPAAASSRRGDPIVVGDRLRRRGDRRTRAARLSQVRQGREGRRHGGGRLPRARAGADAAHASPSSSPSCCWRAATCRSGRSSRRVAAAGAAAASRVGVALAAVRRQRGDRAVRVLDAPRQHRRGCGAARSIASASGRPTRRDWRRRRARARRDAVADACAVIGAGAWGTALADLLARNGHDVDALGARARRRRRRSTSGTRTGASSPARALSPTLRATTDLADALDGASSSSTRRRRSICARSSRAARRRRRARRDARASRRRESSATRSR